MVERLGCAVETCYSGTCFGLTSDFVDAKTWAQGTACENVDFECIWFMRKPVNRYRRDTGDNIPRRHELLHAQCM